MKIRIFSIFCPCRLKKKPKLIKICSEKYITIYYLIILNTKFYTDFELTFRFVLPIIKHKVTNFWLADPARFFFKHQKMQKRLLK